MFLPKRSDVAIQWSDYKIEWVPIVYLGILHLTLIFVPFTFRWSYLFAAILGQAFLGGVGMCVAYHRLLTHRSFDTPKWFEHFLATLGHLSLQGSPIRWVAMHRLHHHQSDKGEDPHSPLHGFWWSHLFWIFIWEKKFDLDEVKEKYARDLKRDAYYRFLDKYDYWVQIAFGALCFLLGGWKFFIWAVCVRLLLTYHTTWFVNSAAHTFGYRNFSTKDRSTNCWWVALLAYGEGWHNNHHAIPRSARHGMKFYEVDFSYYTIRLMKLLGVARNIKAPSSETLRQLREAARQKIVLPDPSEIIVSVRNRASGPTPTGI